MNAYTCFRHKVFSCSCYGHPGCAFTFFHTLSALGRIQGIRLALMEQLKICPDVTQVLETKEPGGSCGTLGELSALLNFRSAELKNQSNKQTNPQTKQRNTHPPRTTPDVQCFTFLDGKTVIDCLTQALSWLR